MLYLGQFGPSPKEKIFTSTVSAFSTTVATFHSTTYLKWVIEEYDMILSDIGKLNIAIAAAVVADPNLI